MEGFFAYITADIVLLDLEDDNLSALNETKPVLIWLIILALILVPHRR